MKDGVIEELPLILKEHISTIKKVSKDSAKSEIMTESMIRVIDFDKIPNEYSRGKGWLSVPTSNDALYKDVEGKWTFIEFKNGTLKTADIYRKIYDSIIMLIDMGIVKDVQYVRENFNYILVYNDEKNKKIQSSESRDLIYSNIMERAKQEEKILNIGKLEGYLFRETHTFTPKQFDERFIKSMEEQEGNFYNT